MKDIFLLISHRIIDVLDGLPILFTISMSKLFFYFFGSSVFKFKTSVDNNLIVNYVFAAIGRFLIQATEPALRPIRRVIPNLGAIDISPVVLLLLIIALRPNIDRLRKGTERLVGLRAWLKERRNSPQSKQVQNASAEN